MIARYVIYLKRPIRMLDHWPINVLGGRMQPLADNDLVHALSFVFTSQPTTIAPRFVDSADGSGSPTLHINDALHTKLREQVKNGFNFIQALFEIEVNLDRTEAEYEAETDDEKALIEVTQFTYGVGGKKPLTLTYDFFTRAMMAAESPSDDSFSLFATLTVSGRGAAADKRYIDSFRYFFLLLEAIFGDGQFKKVGLEKAFKAKPKLLAAIATAAKEYKVVSTKPATPTGIFLKTKPTPEAIIEHIIECRGHYFHNNPAKPKAWKPDKQDEARDLAWLCIAIGFELSEDYSAPIFEDNLGPRHFAEAKASGAILVLKIQYTYRNDDEDQMRRGHMNVVVPGTKVTRMMAAETAKTFLTQFSENLPAAGLFHAVCQTTDTGQPVFELRLPKDLP